MFSNHATLVLPQAIKRPVGVAFITFASHVQASKIRLDHRPNWRCGTNPGNSSLSVILKPHRWSVDFAPRPDEINWGNLAIPSRYWYLRSFLINSLLFIVLFFLTTPAVVVSSLDILQLSTITSSIEKMVSHLSIYSPTFDPVINLLFPLFRVPYYRSSFPLFYSGQHRL